MATNYRNILKQYWGYDDFRGIQAEIVESIGQGKDTLGLMPTGGGKSITFQVPALAQSGICIVVTPLIALMKDQVQNLRQRGIKAVAVYSGLTREEILIALENCIYGDYKFLYISPERLGTELFQLKLSRMQVSFITVDEAHCISQWGYDFRPSYLQIAQVRKLLPNKPVLALTATATPEVVSDIQQRLGFACENVFRMSFVRNNLAYVVRRSEQKESELLRILQKIKGSAIVYTRSRKGTKEIADKLNQDGISALHYHAGLSNAQKDLRQKSWQTDQTRVIVATNAFGMGIDKPDVRVVVHIEMPDSPEAYFQEAGRAGRDGNPAYAVLLCCKGDATKLKRRISDTFPDKDFIRQIYDELGYYFQLAIGSGFGITYVFNLEEFCRNFKHFPVQTDSALRILSRTGYIQYTDEHENSSRVRFLVRRDELYRFSNMPVHQERIIQALLRAYGGLFADYVYIEESLIAQSLGLPKEPFASGQPSNQFVYEGLKELSAQRILHYIPRRKTPYITYMQRRIDTQYLPITTEVYESRKEQYTSRIMAMIHYAESEQICRGRLLIGYFGEKNVPNCMKCDVCLTKHQSGLRQGEFQAISTAIYQLLNDGEPHAIHQLGLKNFSNDMLKIVIKHLVEEEKIRLQDGMLVKYDNYPKQ